MFIHTFETIKILTNEEYYNIQKELKKDNTWKTENNGMLYFGLSDKGIIINMHYTKKKDYRSYSITYRISAYRVIHNNDYVNLFDVSKYNKLEMVVNELLKDKTIYLPELSECSLKRIDFCFNAYLENQKQVKAYIRLLQRADIPSKMKIHTEKDKVQKRNVLPKDGFTVYTKNTIEISIYNKYRQMKKENEKKLIYSEDNLKNAENIVRVEIRCKDKKIKELQKKYAVFTIEEFFNKADLIGHELYMHYLPKFLGNGSIYTLNEAKERLKLSDFRKSTVSLMKDFISDCNASRSGYSTSLAYTKDYGKDKVKRLIQKFDEIDTSYITIPRRDKEIFEDGYIPTLIELYSEFAN